MQSAQFVKFIESLKTQHPNINDLDILIALKASGLRGSEIYCISPQIATKYQRLKEAEASADIITPEKDQIEIQKPKDREWWLRKTSEINTTEAKPEQSQN